MKSGARTLVSLAALGLCALGTVAPATAQELKKWWPVRVMDASTEPEVEKGYEPLDKAEKAHNLCVLFPHLKDSFWVAVNYGIVEEAKRLGVDGFLIKPVPAKRLAARLNAVLMRRFPDRVVWGA